MTKKQWTQADDEEETLPRPKRLGSGEQQIRVQRSAVPPPLPTSPARTTPNLDGLRATDPDPDEKTQSLAPGDINLEPETQLVLSELWLEQRQHAALRASHDQLVVATVSSLRRTVDVLGEAVIESHSQMRQMSLELQELRKLKEQAPESSNTQLAPTVPSPPPQEQPAFSVCDFQSEESTPHGPKKRTFSLFRLSPSGIKAAIRGALEWARRH